jgi:hypothetical protein
VAIKLDVEKSNLAFEAGFPKPEFALFRDGTALLDRLYRRLEPYGLKLADIRFERAGSVGEQHFLVYLFNYSMTIRIRAERIDVACSELPQDLVEKFKAAILDVLRAVKDDRPEISFRTFAVAVGLHAKLEGKSVRDYLGQFVIGVPKGLGPLTGAGAIFYFGAEGERLFATVTADVSAAVADGLFVRVHSAWDAGLVAPEALAGTADAFVRHTLESLGLQLPG